MTEVVARTFLLTDIERSTLMWEEEPGVAGAALAQHERIVEAAVESKGGRLVKSRGEGDSTFSVFERPEGAVAAAMEIQLAMKRHPWPTREPVVVRAAIHAGPAEERDGDFFGPTVNATARLRGTATGGHVLLSGAVADVARDELPDGASIIDLGEHRLRDLRDTIRVFQLAHRELAMHRPAISVSLRGNLPTPARRLVGRRSELNIIASRLRETRLLTLLGAGGVGKTRLATEAARTLASQFSGGGWFVNLATALRGGVAAEFGRLVGAPAEAGPAEIALTLREESMLIVLDNCERHLEEAASLVAAITDNAPGVRMLATSREPIGAADEQLIVIEPLGVAPGGDAVELLLERAGLTSTVDPLELAAAERIAKRLDGLPLAIELAAARAPTLRMIGVERLLDKGIDALPAPRRSRPAHQRTMNAAVRWSYELLDEPARRCFERVAVFPAGFDLDAAIRVCSFGDVDEAAVATAVAELADKSLVAAAPDAHRGGRFRIYEPIRELAEAWGDASDAARARRRCLAWVRELTSEARTLAHEWSADVQGRLDMERANITAVLRRAAAPDANNDEHDEVRVIAANLAHWSGFGALLPEVMPVLMADAVAAPSDDEADAARLLWSVYAGSWGRCAPDEARSRFDAVVSRLRAGNVAPVFAPALLAQVTDLGNVLGLHQSVEDLVLERLGRIDDSGNRFAAYAVVANRAAALKALGRTREAGAAVEASITRLQRAIGAGVVIDSPDIPDDCVEAGRPDAAAALLSDALEHARRTRDGASIVESAFRLALLHADQGCLEPAELFLDEASAQPEGAWPYFAGGLASLRARLHSLRGEYDAARAALEEVTEPGGWAAELALDRVDVEVRAGDLIRAGAELDRLVGDGPAPPDRRALSLLLAQGRLLEVQEHLGEREGGKPSARRSRLLLQAELHRRMGDQPAAAEAAAEAVRLGRAHRSPLTLVRGLHEFALAIPNEADGATASFREAAHYIGASLELRKQLGIVPGRAEAVDIDQLGASLRRSLTNEGVEQAMAAGRKAAAEDPWLNELVDSLPVGVDRKKLDDGQAVPSEVCDQCGFDASVWAGEDRAARLGALAEHWILALSAGGIDLRRRPSPKVWSPLEYAAHTTEVVSWWTEAARKLKAGGVVHQGDDARFDADLQPFATIPHDEVTRKIATALRDLAKTVAGFDPHDWDLPLRVRPPLFAVQLREAGVVDLRGAVLHAVHEAHHHLLDVRKGK